LISVLVRLRLAAQAGGGSKMDGREEEEEEEENWQTAASWVWRREIYTVIFVTLTTHF
jgi:hypothetical protein